MSNDPVANYLFGAPGGLTQNKADYADNVTSAFFVISQLQAKGLATVDITTCICSADTGVNYVNNFEPGTSPDIPTLHLAAGDKVEWVTDSEHNRVLTENGAGKFDIGAFEISGDIHFEDGPTIDRSVQITVGTAA
ncbi:MAG: hypothetical protein E6G89_02770 [Alphaproteobacteria bacterium]|nr:MAG: hypothetical protein E6G89_02770 [Alphaproteobacteria bacterium]